MESPRFRLFAGPNGSGKTTLFKKFRTEGYIHTEFYVNADRFEKELRENKQFSFNAYRVKVSDAEFKAHILSSGLFDRMKEKDFINKLHIISGVLHFDETIKINSYHGSFVASYLAEKLLASKQSFAYETVMSHKSKVQILEQARASGYKTYLYFVFLDNPEVNVFRVKLRAISGEHDVDETTIKERIPRTFAFLPLAFRNADTAYIIDNSNEASLIVTKERDKLTVAKELPGILIEAVQELQQQFSEDQKKRSS